MQTAASLKSLVVLGALASAGADNHTDMSDLKIRALAELDQQDPAGTALKDLSDRAHEWGLRTLPVIERAANENRSALGMGGEQDRSTISTQNVQENGLSLAITRTLLAGLQYVDEGRPDLLVDLFESERAAIEALKNLGETPSSEVLMIALNAVNNIAKNTNMIGSMWSLDGELYKLRQELGVKMPPAYEEVR